MADAKAVQDGLRAAQAAQIAKFGWTVSPEEIKAAGAHPIKAIEAKLTAREKELTSMKGVDLVKLMVEGKLTSEELTTAVCKRAAIAHQFTNCLTEMFFDEGIARAKEIDAEFKKTGKPLGKMHGLPVSLKDDNNVPGKLTTWGLTEWSKKPVQNYGAVPQILKEAGAVFYTKTNVPQCLMTWESDNPVWGPVLNPHNTRVSSGGSSGGEGALVAAGGSILGVGSDIGGSIRLPAGFSGIYGLKPSARRFAYAGSESLFIGIPDAISPVKGPMANSIEDLELYGSVIAGAPSAKLDPDALPFPWTPVTLPTKLKFGYYTTNGLVRPVAPVVRGIEETVAALKAAGHEVVEFKPPSTKELYAYAMFDFGAYMGQFLDLKDKGGDPLVGGMSWIQGGPHDEIKASYHIKTPTLDQLWEGTVVRETVKAQYLAAMNELGVDAIIAPVAALPACPHTKGGKLFTSISYTIQYNVTDLSAGTIPVSFVTTSDVNKVTDFANNMEKEIHEAYSVDEFEGTPISVQVVGRRLEEEKVCAMMKVVDAAVKAAKK